MWGVKAEYAHLKHDHGEGVNVGSLSAVPGWSASIPCIENFRCHPSDIGRDRLGGSLVAQDRYKAVLRDASNPIGIHQDITLWGFQSPQGFLNGRIDAYRCQIPVDHIEPMQVSQAASDTQ